MVVTPISGTSPGSSADSATWTLRHGHTGRSVRGTEGYSLADSWSRADDLRSHDGCVEFAKLIPAAPRIDESIQGFRGRRFTGGPPTLSKMGPPKPAQSRQGGRYHRAGAPALYLCDSELGVRCELNAWRADGVIYVQKFVIPAGEIQIADFSQIPEDHFVTAVFAKAEQYNIHGRDSRGYEFSRLIAELVSGDWDGMCVPGVRGKAGALYRNIVIFQPHPGWTDWLAPDARPYELRE
jgi:hypothetical protein